MTEEILKVFLADLQTIRIVCQRCETITEMNVRKLDDQMKGNACPLCGKSFALGPKDGYNIFQNLARVFRSLEEVKDSVAIEFPVKVGAPSAPPPKT